MRAKGMAEAEAIKARADALAENQDAVIGQQLAEKWPEIVEAAAKPFGDIDQMIVLNGAQGLSDALAQAMSQGVAGLQLARNLLAGGKHGGNGGTRSGGRGRPADHRPPGLTAAPFPVRRTERPTPGGALAHRIGALVASHRRGAVSVTSLRVLGAG